MDSNSGLIIVVAIIVVIVGVVLYNIIRKRQYKGLVQHIKELENKYPEAISKHRGGMWVTRSIDSCKKFLASMDESTLEQEELTILSKLNPNGNRLFLRNHTIVTLDDRNEIQQLEKDWRTKLSNIKRNYALAYEFFKNEKGDGWFYDNYDIIPQKNKELTDLYGELEFTEGWGLFWKNNHEQKKYKEDSVEFAVDCIRNREIIYELNDKMAMKGFCERWLKSQDDFSQKCRDLFKELLNNWGCYQYRIPLDNYDSDGNPVHSDFRVLQIFCSSYCTSSNLDYELRPHVKSNYQQLQQGKNVGLEYFTSPWILKKLIKYIQALEEKFVGIIVYPVVRNSEDKTHYWTLYNLLDRRKIKYVYCDPLAKDVFVKGPSFREELDELNYDRQFVVVDLVTSLEEMKQTCKDLIQICRSVYGTSDDDDHCLNILYLSMLKEHDENEMRIILEQEKKKKEALEREREIERQKKIEAERKINEIRASIPSSLNQIISLVADNRVDEIETQIQAVDNIICYASPEEQSKYEDIKSEYAKKKALGIPQGQDECYVNFNIPDIKARIGYYAIVRMPKEGCIVWPYRRKTIARRGYMELSFEEELKRALNPNVRVMGDVNILPQNDVRPYEPDIALIYSENGLNVRIDVEIDEPYAAITDEPTHYLECGDELRDNNLNNLGWIVVRFSEKQVKEQCKECIKYLSLILHSIDNTYSISEDIENMPSLKPEIQWTKAEAQEMAMKKVRQAYLGHEFGETEESHYNEKDTKLTPFEESIKDKVNHETTGSRGRSSFAATGETKVVSDVDFEYNKTNSFEQDKHIVFDSDKHEYTIDGIRYKAVSEIISRLFPPFDTRYWSTIKGGQRGVDPEQVAEEWEAKGEKSREVGTFMHQQIENYFLGSPISYIFPFRYNGSYVAESDNVDIHTEMKFFNNFLEDVPIVPFRTEWRVYDSTHRIAGTIDLISKDGDRYDMYDWKRTSRIYKDNPYQHGWGELSNMEDTPLNHYIIQQNLYRYILEHQYGLKIRSMNLVVFHPDFYSYELIEVNRLDNKMDAILRMI